MTHKLIITDSFDNRQYRCEIEADTEQEAINEALDIYASELDTDIEALKCEPQ